MQPCSFRRSHMGISESTRSGCSFLPAPMLPVQTDRTCLPDSASNDVHQDRASDPSQRIWLSCCQSSMLSITLIPQQPSSSLARIPGSFGWPLVTRSPLPCHLSLVFLDLPEHYILLHFCRASGYPTLVHSRSFWGCSLKCRFLIGGSRVGFRYLYPVPTHFDASSLGRRLWETKAALGFILC